MERELRFIGNARADEIYGDSWVENGYEDDTAFVSDRMLCCRNRENDRMPVSFSSPASPASPTASSSALNFIEHPVSKFDTLAGVAIKYGVEVADIKKMNGLVTDLQIYALKFLQIPLPGRHPPSTCVLSDGSVSSGQSGYGGQQMHNDLLETFQSLKRKSSQEKISPAMTSLQGYYGLKPLSHQPKTGSLDISRYSSIPISPISPPRKSRSLANCLLDEIEEVGEADSDTWSEKLIKSRQKPEANFGSRAPVKLLKEENSGNTMISSITGKGLAQRPKAASRNSTMNVDSGANGLGFGPVRIPLCHSHTHLPDAFGVVKKSSSTSSLHDPDGASSLWSQSKTKLKSDFQALSTAAMITGRRNKAALD